MPRRSGEPEPVEILLVPIDAHVGRIARHLGLTKRADQTWRTAEEVTAELPMLAFTFTRKSRPMTIGSLSGWLTLAGSTARPAAISSRTCSGVVPSRSAANSISGVTRPRRA